MQKFFIVQHSGRHRLETMLQPYGMNPDTALYSRKPGGVSAEVTNIVEFELGWRLTKEFRVQINAYQQWVNDIIEFRYNYFEW
jgi:hypothetical protein